MGFAIRGVFRFGSALGGFALFLFLIILIIIIF
jgi:hypothetical protein